MPSRTQMAQTYLPNIGGGTAAPTYGPVHNDFPTTNWGGGGAFGYGPGTGGGSYIESNVAAGNMPATGNVANNAPDNSISDLTAQALIASILAEYGLGGVGLETLVMEWITNGVTDRALLRALIEDTEQFKARFPAMAMRQQQGLSRISAAEYIGFENYAATLFADFGLPPGFYDERGDFTDFIASFADVASGRSSLQRRVQGGFVAVATAAPEIRDAFSRYFGVAGDAALAAFFLDADRAIPALEAQVQLAQIGGAGGQFGFNVSMERADMLRGRGITESSAREGFSQVSELNPLLRETIGESVDYTAENEGISSVFRLNQESVDRLRRRMEQRQSAFGGGGGFTRGQGGGLAGLRVGR